LNKLQTKISWKEIYSIALPAIAAGIAEPVISLVDTAFVGQLGTLELGAVGIGASFFTLIMWILAQTKSAISAIVSKSFGAKTLYSLQSFVPQALTLNF
jgi:Na+-driven multidrug efflux pump